MILQSIKKYSIRKSSREAQKKQIKVFSKKRLNQYWMLYVGEWQRNKKCATGMSIWQDSIVQLKLIVPANA